MTQMLSSRTLVSVILAISVIAAGSLATFAPNISASHCNLGKRHVQIEGQSRPACLTDAEIAEAGIGGAGDGVSVQDVLTAALKILSWIAGIISVVMIIIAGFRYITSQGGDGTATARNTILYAVVGIIIVAFAQIILRFVLGHI